MKSRMPSQKRRDCLLALILNMQVNRILEDFKSPSAGQNARHFFGDRRQEIVFIGIDLDQVSSCALTFPRWIILIRVGVLVKRWWTGKDKLPGDPTGSVA